MFAGQRFSLFAGLCVCVSFSVGPEVEKFAELNATFHFFVSVILQVRSKWVLWVLVFSGICAQLWSGGARHTMGVRETCYSF